MSTFLVMNGGTKSSGASTITGDDAVDWVVANAYSSTNWQAAFNKMGASGDVVIFDDAKHTPTGQMDLGSVPSTAVVGTLRSRSGDPSLCTISIDSATAQMFAINPAAASGKVHQLTFQNITFTREQTFTANSCAICPMTNDAGSTTFEGCVFRDITISNTDADTDGCLFNPYTTTGGHRVITFTDCSFINISVTANCRPWISLDSNYDNEIVISNMAISGCDYTYLNETTGGRGIFSVPGSGANQDITIDGMTIENLSVTGGGQTFIAGVVFLGGSFAGECTIDNLHADGLKIANSGAETPGMILQMLAGSATIRNSSVTNAVCDTVGNSTGLLALSNNDSSLTVENCSAYNNRGFYGCCAYNTHSSSMTVIGCTAYNNVGGSGLGAGGVDINGVDFYSGGTGSVTLIGCASWGSTCEAGTASASVDIIHNNAAPRTNQAKVITIQNCSFTSPSSTVPTLHMGTSGAQSEDATATITNSIITGGSGTVQLSDTAGVTLTVTANNSIYGTMTTPTNGGLTENNKVGTSPGFVSSTDLNLASDSDAVGAGISWGSMYAYVGPDGEPFPRYGIDVGAYQSSYAPFHPVNL